MTKLVWPAKPDSIFFASFDELSQKRELIMDEISVVYVSVCGDRELLVVKTLILRFPKDVHKHKHIQPVSGNQSCGAVQCSVLFIFLDQYLNEREYLK